MTLEEKIVMIRASESLPKPTHSCLSIQFGIGRSTVGDILKKRKRYEDQWKKNIYSKRCRISKSTHADAINEKMYLYFTQALIKKLPVNGPILQNKALEIARELGVEEFKASNGWLDSWKKRFNIKKFRIAQETTKEDVDMSLADDYKFRLSSITSSYPLENIFNCDETGLFFRALPDRNLEQSQHMVKDGELSKQRLTILLCCSSTGEKLKPLVIGRTDLSQVCKDLHTNQLPVHWRCNQKVWMETQYFIEWLQNLNKQMQMQKRRIILFMDSSTSHIASDIILSHVTIMLIPAFSCLQPLESGIKEEFKSNYRKRLMHHIITHMKQHDTALQVSKQVNVLHAVSWLACAWKEVSPTLISQCFSQCGFDMPVSCEDIANTDESFQQLLDTASVTGMKVDLTAKEYICVDDDLQTENPDILTDMKNHLLKDELQQDSGDEDTEILIPSHSDALHHLGRLAVYFSNKDEECANLIDLITQIVSKNENFEKLSHIQSMINAFHSN